LHIPLKEVEVVVCVERVVRIRKLEKAQQYLKSVWIGERVGKFGRRYEREITHKRNVLHVLVATDRAAVWHSLSASFFGGFRAVAQQQCAASPAVRCLAELCKD
jgi:hypothetical protein